MTEEEFRKIYSGTHAELSLMDAVGNGSLIAKHPEDKNITKHGKIPGKHLIEAHEMKKRVNGLRHMLLDACSAKAKELMDMPAKDIFSLAIKALPAQHNQVVQNNFTFAEMVSKAKMDTVETIDVEDE